MRVEYEISGDTMRFLQENTLHPSVQDRLREAEERGTVIGDNGFPTDAYLLQLTASERDRLVEELADLFWSIGIDPNGEPNDTGRFIETIIDRFSPYPPE